MSYIGTEPKDIRSFGRTKFDYTATQGQTAFTGADDDGKVLAFTTGQINVFVNGILMDDSDFTTTGTGTVTLASAANLNDVINIVSFESNIPDNDYVPASGGTFTGNITVNSQVGIGSAPMGVETLTVAKSSGTPTIRVNAPSGSEAQLKLQANGGGTTIPMIAAKTDGALSFSRWTGAAYTERMRILPDGGLTFNGDTAAANALDDYEVGDFTPALTGYTNVTGTMTGKYVKIGSFVHCHVYMNITALTYSGNTRITGWPFTPSRTINQHPGQGTIGTGTALNVDPHLYHMGFYNQTANLYLYNKNSGGALTGNNYQVGVLGINVTYQTDD